jgi:hypothetical protein
MHLLSHVPLARQRTHQSKQQMNFHVGKLMNCPMRLGLFGTTCPQQLWEQNPVKVVFCPLRLKTSRSYSRLWPLFLLVLFHETKISIVDMKVLMSSIFF